MLCSADALPAVDDDALPAFNDAFNDAYAADDGSYDDGTSATTNTVAATTNTVAATTNTVDGHAADTPSPLHTAAPFGADIPTSSYALHYYTIARRAKACLRAGPTDIRVMCYLGARVTEQRGTKNGGFLSGGHVAGGAPIPSCAPSTAI